MIASKALKQYANVSKSTGIEDANPHQLIMMLYEGALDSLMTAIGCIERKDFAGKGQSLGKAITIIGGLQGFLDMEKGGDVARNLDRLYDYMGVRLYDATIKNDVAIVHEVVGLLKTVKEGWDGIKEEAARIYQSKDTGATPK